MMVPMLLGRMGKDAKFLQLEKSIFVTDCASLNREK